MSRRLLGLDIRHNAISAVLIRSGIKGSWIENHLHIPIPTDVHPWEDALENCLESLHRQMDIADAVCIVALPATDIAYRNLKAPFKESKKVRQILPFELETDLPFQAENIVFDFHMLNDPAGGNIPLLFAAVAEQQYIDAVVEKLIPLGMEPDILTVGSYTTGNYLFRLSEENNNSLFLDIEDTTATMVLSMQGDICLVRTFAIPSQENGRYASIGTQMQRTILAFEQKTGCKCDITDVRVSGLSSEEKELDTEIESRLGAPSSRIDLMDLSQKVILSSKGESWQPHLMDGALSLVLNELSGFDTLNFRRGHMGMQKIWLENKKDIIKTGVLAIVVLMLYLGYSIIDTYTLKQLVDTKKTEVVDVFRSTFPEVNQIVDPVHQMRVKLEEAQKNLTFPGERSASVKTIDILNNISQLTPAKQDVELVSIVVGADTVVISGNTDTFNAVDDMKNELEGAEIFQNVSISSANMDQAGKRVRFKLKVVL